MRVAVQQGIIDSSSLEVKTWLSGLFKMLRKLEVADETQQQINMTSEKAPDGETRRSPT